MGKRSGKSSSWKWTVSRGPWETFAVWGSTVWQKAGHEGHPTLASVSRTGNKVPVA